MTTTGTTPDIAMPTESDHLEKGLFEEQVGDGSLKHIGMAVAIAMLILFAIFIVLIIVGLVIRRRTDQQLALMRLPLQPTQRAPRTSLFPLSLPTLCSKARVNQSASAHTVLVHKPSYNSFSDASTLASSTKDSKLSKDLDLEAQAVAMPLPPPPSYQEIPMTGPIHSISRSSWVTEGPTIEEPIRGGRRAKKYGGRATRRF